MAKKLKKDKISKVTKAYGYRKALTTNLLGFSNAFNTPQQKSVGRPKNLFKHTSPLTGKPVPAEIYYSHMREFKRLQQQRVEDMKEQKIRELAKKGIPPNQIQEYQQTQNQMTPQQLEYIRQQQILQQINARQPTQQRLTEEQARQLSKQLPNGTVINQSTSVWKGRRATVDEDWGLFGRRKVLRGLPSSFFN